MYKNLTGSMYVLVSLLISGFFFQGLLSWQNGTLLHKFAHLKGLGLLILSNIPEVKCFQGFYSRLCSIQDHLKNSKPFISSLKYLKSLQNKKGLNDITTSPFWCLFLNYQLQKNNKNRAAVTSLRPFFFVTTLALKK